MPKKPLRIVAYCMESVARTTHRATGAWPLTSPLFEADTFPYKILERADVIWLALHGVPTQPTFLYGDEARFSWLPAPMRVRALDARDIRPLDLRGKVVFATTCYFPETDFPAAFKRAGAVVVGGPGKNYGDTRRLRGADKLGAVLVAGLRRALSLAEALAEAKAALDEQSEADVDAKEFGVL